MSVSPHLTSLKVSFHCALASIVSDEKLLIIYTPVSCFVALKIYINFLFVFVFQYFDYIVPGCASLCFEVSSRLCVPSTCQLYFILT